MRKLSKTVPREEWNAAIKDVDLHRIMLTILAREEPHIEFKYTDEGRVQRLRLYRAMAPCGGYVLALLKTETHLNVHAYYLEDLHQYCTQRSGTASPFDRAVWDIWEARNKLYQENAG